ncbi:ABC transporter ATP-binding protein [Paenibacillus sp. FSL K6-1558]|uniref:ABC transporter ATP-binding protein n=1 Tax=Paenibacillus sp. FSL K6-1558 TaxID=2921473 RepID=UPI0030F641B0
MDKTVSYSAAKTFSRLIKHSKSYLILYICLLLIIVCLAFINLGYLESIRRIISGATSKSLQAVYIGAFLAIATTLVQIVLGLLQDRVMIKVKNESISGMQRDVLNEIYRKKQESLEDYHSSDLLGRLLSSVTNAQTGVNEKFLVLFQNLLQILFSLAYFSWLNFPLTIGLISFTLAYPMMTYPISRFLRNHYDRQGDEVAKRDVILQESVQGVEEVRTFQLQKHLRLLLSDRLHQVLQRTFKISILERSIDSLNRFATFGGMIFTLGFGGYQVFNGDLAVASLATFVVTSGQLINPLLSISSLWTDTIQSLTQAQRVFTIIDLPDEKNNGLKGRVSSDNVNAYNLTFENLKYSYSNGNKGLKNFNLKINSGQTVAIVGPSGSGKSTLMKLLLRFYDPEQGKILYGDVPINDIDIHEWRSCIGYVSQDAVIFTGSIRDNICFGLNNASSEEIEFAARLAHLHDRIVALPEGYNTVIGERGVSLSGGEIQRLSLARVYLRRPAIFLLDEPTSALDIENEKKFKESIDYIAKECTTFIVAHNLETIRHADIIVYLKDGVIEEIGSHEELINKQGEYYRLLQNEYM